MIWKLRYAWDMARNVGFLPADKWRFYWRSAVASYPEAHEEMTPEDAVSEDIAAWY